MLKAFFHLIVVAILHCTGLFTFQAVSSSEALNSAELVQFMICLSSDGSGWATREGGVNGSLLKIILNENKAFV